VVRCRDVNRGYKMNPSECYGIILAGIEGADKTRLAELIDRRLGWRTYDTDDLLPPGVELARRRTKDEKALSEKEKQIRSIIFTKQHERVFLP
jgi:shikimate kinase